MGKIKKSICALVFLAFFLLACVSGLLYCVMFCKDVLQPGFYTLFPAPCTITTETVQIEKQEILPANNVQIGSSVWMGAYGGKLYFYPTWCSEANHRYRYYGYLSVFENGTATRLTKLGDSVIGIIDDRIYYVEFPSDWRNEETIFCYCVSTGEQTVVLEDSLNGNFFTREQYMLNDKIYTLDSKGTGIVVTDSLGNKTTLNQQISNGNKHMFLLDSGLLIHNDGKEDLLCFVNKESGEVETIFRVPGIVSQSCVNVYGDYIYLSFDRHRYDESIDSYVPYEEDALKGTYRISHDDFSAEKISSNVYTGIFVFDDTGIFVCDEYGHIFKLDRNGNLVLCLLN